MTQTTHSFKPACPGVKAIPIEPQTTPRVLRLNLKREYWEAIRDGEKIYEYRQTTVYWMRRLTLRKYDEIHLCLGYPNRGQTERVLKRKWKTAPAMVEITHKHFGQNPVIVYAIDVSEAA